MFNKRQSTDETTSHWQLDVAKLQSNARKTKEANKKEKYENVSLAHI